MTPGRPRFRARPTAAALTVVAVVLVALNLRGAIAAVPPLMDEMGAALRLTPADLSLLTTLPVLLFALAAPLAAWAGRRYGPGHAVLLGLSLVAVGTLGRTVGGPVTLFLFTALIGLGITVGNVLVPVVVKRDYGDRASRVTGYYTATLAVGAAITSALTVPLAQVLGWRGALAAWVVIVPLAMLAWWRYVVRPRQQRTAGRRSSPGETPEAGGVRHTPAVRAAHRDSFVWRLPIAWALAIALGAQSALYYSLTTWMPTLLVDRAGVSAGVGGAARAGSAS